MRAPASCRARPAWNSHVPQPLYHDALSLQAGLQAQGLHVLRVIACLPNAEEHPLTSCFDAPAHAPLANRLPRDAGLGIQGIIAELVVGVEDPRHFLRARSIIRCRNPGTWTDEVLAHEFEGVAPGYPFQFGLGEISPGYPHAALRSPKRHVDHGAFVGHECGECHHFVLRDGGCRTGYRP